MSKPVVEVLVEGELSPFEHEALYKLHGAEGTGKALREIDYAKTL